MKVEKVIRVIDQYNHDKIWEVTITPQYKYYVQQFICGIPQGSRKRTTKNWLKEIGVM